MFTDTLFQGCQCRAPVSTAAGGAWSSWLPSAATTLDRLSTKALKAGPGLGGCACALAASSRAASATCAQHSQDVSV